MKIVLEKHPSKEVLNFLRNFIYKEKCREGVPKTKVNQEKLTSI